MPSVILVLSNEGQVRFRERARIEVDHSFSLAAADFDEDGDLDLYACVYYSDRATVAELPIPMPIYNATNGGASVDMTLGFDDATSVAVTLSSPDWFADFDPVVASPALGVASAAIVAGPLSGGDGFPAVEGVAAIEDRPAFGVAGQDDLRNTVDSRNIANVLFELRHLSRQMLGPRELSG